MKQHIKVAVIGGTGKSGKYLVQQLIQQGYFIKLLVRNPDHAPIQNPRIKIVHGNVTDYAAVHALLEDCQAVISTLGLGVPASEPTIFSQSTLHILKAMHDLNIHRYVVTTGLNVDTPFDQKGLQAAYGTEWMKKTFPASTTNKQDEYKLLAASNVNWTMVRLPAIEQTQEAPSIQINLRDCPGDKISATSLANFLVGQLTDESYIRQAPFIANG
ncbi:MAG: NAD(P)-dependent oxidoreductase [Cytophaga sp.]|uniref:NAD(P)-dependent oxidoreductase n=1 Tax=Cytophaga sp. TaxID=29535 RepID=UPI003F7F341E